MELRLVKVFLTVLVFEENLLNRAEVIVHPKSIQLIFKEKGDGFDRFNSQVDNFSKSKTYYNHPQKHKSLLHCPLISSVYCNQ